MTRHPRYKIAKAHPDDLYYNYQQKAGMGQLEANEVLADSALAQYKHFHSQGFIPIKTALEPRSRMPISGGSLHHHAHHPMHIPMRKVHKEKYPRFACGGTIMGTLNPALASQNMSGHFQWKSTLPPDYARFTV